MQDKYSNAVPSSRWEWRDYSRRVGLAVLIVIAVLGGILLLWVAARVFLLFFAAVLFAIFLRTCADFVGRLVHLSRDWALGVTIALLLLICAGAGFLLATPVSKQIDQISDELPQATQKLEGQLQQYSWGKSVVEKIHNPGGLASQTGGMLKKAQSFFSVTLEGIVDFLVILFCGFYLAARPETYARGFLRLIPATKRDRGQEVLDAIGTELRHWMFGQIISMTIIGLLTWLGLFLLGIPASELLGIMAGILDFVPVAGPFVAGLVSCVIALLRSPWHALYVLCLFMALHLLEGHVIIPVVQRRATRLPPVLTILAMVLFYMLFGFLGLLLAVPLLALVLITTRTLYVENVIEG